MRKLCVYLFLSLLGCGTVMADCDYIPLLEEGKEWGYVNYFSESATFDNEKLEFYRLCCGPAVQIYGKEYTPIYKYSSFAVPDKPVVIAYMREENGKVYRHHTTDYGSNFEWDDILDVYGQHDEYLLYDFNMEVGDEMTMNLTESESAGDEIGINIILKCIDKGVIDTEYGPRKFLRFDKSKSFQTSRVPFDYIIEGIGPVGNCNFAIPYRYPERMSMVNHFFDIDLLYQRHISTPDSHGNRYQGAMMYKSPVFDVMGVYDKSVWFWPSEHDNGDAVQSVSDGNVALPDLSIFGRNSTFWVQDEDDGVIEEVIVYDALGRELDRFCPGVTEFTFHPNTYQENIVVVKATTGSGSRSFRYFRLPEYTDIER